MKGLYMQITLIKGTIGLTECELLIESWFNSEEMSDVNIKLGTYNFHYPSKNINIKLGNKTLKVKLNWNTRLGMRGFVGKILTPKELVNMQVVINNI